MVVGIVGAAIPAASNAYMKAVDASNAQVLLSTAMTVLRNELSNASEISFPDANTIEYRSGNTGRKTQIVSSEGEFSIKEYGVESVVEKDGVKSISVTYDPLYTRSLVSKKAITDNLSLTFSSVTKSNGLITIGELDVMREGSENPIAVKKNFSIRTLG